MNASDGYDAYSDSALFDVFYETGTKLGAILLEAERLARDKSDHCSVEKFRNRWDDMAFRRQSINPRNRAAQGAAIQEWTEEIEEIEELLRAHHPLEPVRNPSPSDNTQPQRTQDLMVVPSGAASRN